ncbi:unnamed protein product [Protopolystoma xenopodis]|uniref:Uncharacterized protein n=1 Tax=Protopolystoma xenopodis TaxID=117903 RepID=A0A448WTZ4_9PLAT|nr:unnamed protein product [Protopolystoma xenopodis]
MFHDSRPLAVPKVRCRALTTSGQKVERICSNNSSKVIILAVATALWRVSRMRRNRKMMRRAGVIQVLARLIAVGDSDLLVPVMGILQECASEMSFRASIRSEGILVHLLPYLRNDSPEVKIACARTLFQLVQDDETLEELHRFNAPLIFYHLLQEYVPLAQNALEAGWLDWADIWSELDPHNIVLLKDQELGSPSRLNFAKIISTRLTEPSFETSGPTGRMQDVLASSGKPGLRELRLTKRTSRPRDPDPAVVPANTKPKNATKMSLSFHLLHILLGVVWKCAGKQQMRYTFVELGTTKLLLQLASFLPAYFTPYSRPVCSVSLRLSRQGVLEHITEHVLYTLSELAEHQRVRLEVLADVQIGPILVDLLRYESSALLISTMKAITCLSRCEKLLERFIEQKVFRHLYSHLLHPTMGVRSAALLAMHEFLAYTPKSESLVRPIAGSLSNLITCLVEAYDGMITAENQERQQEMEALLAAVCSVASMIGKHPIQRLILVELGLAGPLVSVITEAHTDKIREAVAKTITEFGMVPKIAAHLSNMQVSMDLGPRYLYAPKPSPLTLLPSDPHSKKPELQFPLSDVAILL